MEYNFVNYLVDFNTYLAKDSEKYMGKIEKLESVLSETIDPYKIMKLRQKINYYKILVNAECDYMGIDHKAHQIRVDPIAEARCKLEIDNKMIKFAIKQLFRDYKGNKDRINHYEYVDNDREMEKENVLELNIEKEGIV